MPLASAALQLAADALTDLTGAVVASGPGSAAAAIADDAVTTAKILAANVTAAKLASNAVETAKILDANVTLAKLADLAQSTAIGRAAGAGTGAPVALSASQLAAILPNGSITLAQLADLAQASFILRAAGAGTGVPIAGTAAQAAAILGFAGGPWVEDVVSGSAVQDLASSLSISGTGQDYEFEGKWVAPNATFNATLQPNSLGTNQRDWRFGNATSGAYVNDHTDIRLGSFSAAGAVVFSGRIVQLTGIERLIVCDMYQTEGATLIGNRGVALWNVTTEITGLRLHASTGNNLGVGSTLRVRKI